MKYPPYPAYKPSGVAWLGDVPEHWEVRRLKTAATSWVSNVDKVPAEGEIPVRLCNYTDVYYNDRITPNLPLMETTATGDEIRRFGLRVGDVLATKDSESWSDIAVPALVTETSNDLVCGYHLAIIRPNPERLLGEFLFRTLQTASVNRQFQVAASGVTRYGLPKSAVGEAWVALPSTAEQRAIGAFLDAQTSKLDTLVEKKRALIERLRERRAALISRTVTRGLPPEAARAAGLDPHPPLKPSGIEWLGEVPAHWVTPPLYVRYSVDLGKMLNEGRITGVYLLPYLRNVDVQWGTINQEDLPEMDIAPHEWERYIVREGDLLVCEGGEVGRAAIVGSLGLRLAYQKAIHRLRSTSNDEDPRYLFYTLRWATSQGLFESEGNQSTILHLTGEKLRRYRFPTPPLAEQRAIADYLDRETARIDALVATVEAAIERLQEYRAALIAAAVTGRIDVRGAIAKPPGAHSDVGVAGPEPSLLPA